MNKKLVIVESPAKARTLGRILGKSYSLKASLGHVRDLPRSELGLDMDNDFTPKYVVPRTKSKVVNELKKAAKDASAIYLATDPDREGEAISWHIAEVIKTDSKPLHRVVFHEITDEAIKHAFKHLHSIDMQLVNAQQARRVLDRLVGYKISPLLWKKVRRGLSAGRVQSVVVRIIVEREREIIAFIPVEYWTIEAELTKKTGAKKSPPFRAMLISLAAGKKIDIHNREEAAGIEEKLEKAAFSVLDVSTKTLTRQPAPPFITSTLQQEAWRKLRFSANYTMSIAQQLYEGLPVGDEGSVGLITYMRTDSTNVARSSLAETRDYIGSKYGSDYLPPKARSFTRKAKGAQEAHEAIRPTKIWREPDKIKPYLSNSQFKLYDLIWKRMVASQMAAALFDSITVDIEARSFPPETVYLFQASSSKLKFPGFITLYTEGRDDAEKETEDTSPLPELKKGDALKLLGIFPEQHFTQPPPRFTEATLVKMLEQKGIGRPSTYAPILSTIQDRGYVTRTSGIFQPTELGFVVNDLLCKHFADIVDIDFTARMEEELDEIARENKVWVDVIHDFYKPFEKDIDSAAKLMEKVELKPELTDETCPNCGKPLAIKQGRFGKFVACTGYPQCKFTKPYQIKTGVKCPECGNELVEKISKKKKTFYGCSNYPECTFATSFKPLPEPCPKCGSLLTVYRRNWAKCTKCSYRSRLPGEQPVGKTQSESE